MQRTFKDAEKSVAGTLRRWQPAQTFTLVEPNAQGPGDSLTVRPPFGAFVGPFVNDERVGIFIGRPSAGGPVRNSATRTRVAAAPRGVRPPAAGPTLPREENRPHA